MSIGNKHSSSLPNTTLLIFIYLVLLSLMLISSSTEARPLTQMSSSKRSSLINTESKRDHTNTSGYQDTGAVVVVKKSGPSPGEGH